MKNNIFLLFLVLLLPGLFWCRTSVPPWPDYITNSLWHPNETLKTKFTTYLETYTLEYKAKVCFPAENLIETMATDMRTKGWERLEFDFLGSGIHTHYSRPSFTFAFKWGHFLDGTDHIYLWMDDWKDSKNNIIRYSFRYRSKERVDEFAQKPCTVEGTATFIPAEQVDKMIEYWKMNKEGGAGR